MLHKFNLLCLALLSVGTTQGEISYRILEECRRENSSPLTSLVHTMCLYKCFYEKSGLVDQKGTFLLNQLKTDPELARLPEYDKERLFDCLETVDKIQSCHDIVNVTRCFHSKN
ncbi:uncharacterized protein LOC126265816 [Aethina tumida]|nr:uncharacterized protein LOC126265816 [Aethina tumida]